MKILLKYLLLFGLIFLMFSCKKEDEELPQISFICPLENEVYNVFDSIIVSGNIIDNEQITSVEVYLCDENYKIVIPTQNNLKVNANPFTFSCYLVIDNAFLPSNDYYVCIKASDGKNIKYKYQKVKVIGIDKSFLELIISSYDGIFTFDSQTLAPKFSALYQKNKIEFLSRYQQLLVISNYLYSIDFQTLDTLWAIDDTDVLSNNFVIFAKVLNDKIVVSRNYNSEIEFYNHLGMRTKVLKGISGYNQWDIEEYGDYYVVLERPIQSGKNRLSVYYSATGLLKQSIEVDFYITDFQPLYGGDWLVCGTENYYSGVIKTYKISTNTFQTPFVIFNSENYKQMTAIDLRNFVIRSDNTVYALNYNQGYLYTLLSNFSATDLEFDPLNNRIYVLSESLLKVFSYPSYSLIYSFPMPYQSTYSCLRYNY